jgi:FMN reductase
MGLGGSLRAASTSRTALEVALQAMTAAGAHARLVWVRDLDLPLYTADLPVPKPVGLVTTAGGVQGLQAINSMEFIVRALRGWSVPLVQPVAQSWRSFGRDGRLADDAVADQLRALGAEVVWAARHDTQSD